MENDYITTDDVRRATAHQLGLPFIDLKDQALDLKVLSFIPEPVARQHNIVAVRKNNNVLEVAMLDIADLVAIEFVAAKFGLKILPRLTDDKSIKIALVRYQQQLKEQFGERLKQTANVPHVAATLLAHALMQQASDIHIEPLAEDLLIRYRFNGALHEAMVLAKTKAGELANHFKQLAGLAVAVAGLQDGRFVADVNGEAVTFKLVAMPTAFGEKIILKPIPSSSKGLSLEALGFSHDQAESVYEALAKKQGLILLVGQAGSGKTTTFYTLLDLLNQPALNIVTIENPIEHLLPRITQIELNKTNNLTLPAVLRFVAKQDVDVLAIGQLSAAADFDLAVNIASQRLVLAVLAPDSQFVPGRNLLLTIKHGPVCGQFEVLGPHRV